MKYSDMVRERAANVRRSYHGIATAKQLEIAATGLEDAVFALAADPSEDNMTRLNGVWAYAAGLMRATEPSEPTPKASAA